MVFGVTTVFRLFLEEEYTEGWKVVGRGVRMFSVVGAVGEVCGELLVAYEDFIY